MIPERRAGHPLPLSGSSARRWVDGRVGPSADVRGGAPLQTAAPRRYAYGDQRQVVTRTWQPATRAHSVPASAITHRQSHGLASSARNTLTYGLTREADDGLKPAVTGASVIPLPGFEPGFPP
jgi:hypothetical protein